jgi:threonine/homoserine/homoserine lactone efflux protein
MNQAIGQVLSLGVGVALSPIPIVAVVVLLATPRARGNGLGFGVGWIAGLALVGTIVLLVSSGAGASAHGQPATWVSIGKIVLGVLLLALAARRWRSRPHGGEHAKLPKWMRSIDAFSPAKALASGVLLSAVNPKNLLLTLAAAAAIAQTGISAGKQAVTLAVFVVLGTLGVGAPIALFFALGDRSRALLNRLRSWMAANNATIMTVLVLIFGAKLIGDGIGSL